MSTSDMNGSASTYNQPTDHPSRIQVLRSGNIGLIKVVAVTKKCFKLSLVPRIFFLPMSRCPQPRNSHDLESRGPWQTGVWETNSNRNPCSIVSEGVSARMAYPLSIVSCFCSPRLAPNPRNLPSSGRETSKFCRSLTAELNEM
jgi:hypothetical protein